MVHIAKFKDMKPLELSAPGPRIRGRFKLTVRSSDSGLIVRETPWIDNLVTDAGLDNIGSSQWGLYCSVGTGNTTPSNGDTSLAARVATTSTTQGADSNVASGAPDYTMTFTRTYRFNQGTFSGHNLQEVGVGTLSGGTDLSTRALITPAVTVLSHEFLDVTYQYIVYFQTVDATDVISIGGDPYDITIRAANTTNNNSLFSTDVFLRPFDYTGYNSVADGYSGVIGGIASQPTGTADQMTDTKAAYVNGNHYGEMTCFAGINDCNFGGTGMRSMRAQTNRGFFQYGFSRQSDSNGIDKDNTKTLTIVVRHHWARH